MNRIHSVYFTAFLCAGHLGVASKKTQEEEIRERELREKLDELKQLVSEFEALDEKLSKLERAVRNHKGA